MSKKKRNRIKQTEAELMNHLKEHILFLSRSAKAFDDGMEGEAKRMAVSLRVLLHDAGNSHSLLDQLGQKISFYNTANKYDPNNMLTHHGLTALHVKSNEAKHIAPLSNRHKDKTLRQTFFAEWWNEPVIVDKSKNKFSRRDLILSVVNQDGGAHVDPELDEAYAKLSRENTVGWVFTKGGRQYPVKPVELASIRQVCYEVLYTLKKKYPDSFLDDMTLEFRGR
jgi:hypothetical protein